MCGTAFRSDPTRIQRRGRWVSKSSVRCYMNSGRLQQMFTLLDKDVQSFAVECESKLDKGLDGQLSSLAPQASLATPVM
eukprot:3391950-Amphidinium_carterae.1